MEMNIARDDQDLVQRKASSKTIVSRQEEKFETHLAWLREAQKRGEDICISYQNNILGDDFSVRLFSCDNFTDEEYYLLAYGIPAEINKPLTKSLAEATIQMFNKRLTDEQYEVVKAKTIELMKTYREIYHEEYRKLHTHGGWQY